MSLTNAERAARHKENKKKQGYRLIHVWVDPELNAMIESLLVTRQNLTKEKALQSVLYDAFKAVTSNVTSNKTSVASNEIIVTSNDKMLSENTELKEKIELLNKRIVELEKAVTSNKQAVASNVTSNKTIVTSNDSNMTSQVKFDLAKSKEIAKELKAQGYTGNMIAAELTRQGYGNKFGKPFSKSSINKWKL